MLLDVIAACPIPDGLENAPAQEALINGFWKQPLPTSPSKAKASHAEDVGMDVETWPSESTTSCQSRLSPDEGRQHAISLDDPY
jgi:hypothetical protein